MANKFGRFQSLDWLDAETQEGRRTARLGVVVSSDEQADTFVDALSRTFLCSSAYANTTPVSSALPVPAAVAAPPSSGVSMFRARDE